MNRQTSSTENSSSSGGGLFSSIKSMVSDLTSSSPQPSQQQPTSQVKRPSSSSSSGTSSSNNLFPSLSVLQSNLPQEIQRVKSVLQGSNVSLSQMEQGERALDDLISVLSSQLAELCELRKENSQKLIHRLKQTNVSSNTHTTSSSTTTNQYVPPSVSQQQSPQTASKVPNNTQPPTSKAPQNTNKSTTTPQSPQQGFGALASRGQKPTNSTSTTKSQPSSTNNAPGKVDSIDSILVWQENEVPVQPLVMGSGTPPPTNTGRNTPPTAQLLDPLEMTFDSTTLSQPSVQAPSTPLSDSTNYHAPPGLDSLLQPPSVSDILGGDSLQDNSKKQPSENDFNLDQILGTSKKQEPVGEMLDFSNEGQKIFQSNQILSMFDKQESQDHVVGATIDVEVQDDTGKSNPSDDFDF